MKRLIKYASGVLFVSVLVTACASPPPRPVPLAQKLLERGYVIGKPVKRLKNYRINGWNSIDRYHVIIHAGVKEDFLVTVRNPCDGFRSAEILTFSTTVSDLTDKDKLVVRGAGGFVEQCYIKSIHVLSRTKKPARHH
jgi:hypothetical protein